MSEKKRIKIVNLIWIIIVILLITALFYYLFLSKLDFEKTYSGLSIKEVDENYENYLNQSVTFEAWYDHDLDYDEIEQYDVFGEYEGDMKVYIDNNLVDTSMLIIDREYYWTGIIGREAHESEFTYENVTYRNYWNITYLNVTKIEPLYDDVERHNTTRFIGTWKLIEEDNEPYTHNWTYILYENNSLRSMTPWDDSWDRFVIDGNIFYHEYHWIAAGHQRIDYYFADYFFSENYTKLTIDMDDGRIIRVFQKL